MCPDRMCAYVPGSHVRICARIQYSGAYVPYPPPRGVIQIGARAWVRSHGMRVMENVPEESWGSTAADRAGEHVLSGAREVALRERGVASRERGVAWIAGRGRLRIGVVSCWGRLRVGGTSLRPGGYRLRVGGTSLRRGGMSCRGGGGGKVPISRANRKIRRGRHGDRLRMIGNAVPPLLARALADALARSLT